MKKYFLSSRNENNDDDGFFHTDHCDFEHYEVDFNSPTWESDLEFAMNKFLDYHLVKE